MQKVEIHAESLAGVTVISNLFVDNFMVQASGEFVKVYLMLLRMGSCPGQSVTISEIADRMNCTEKDVLRALRYWERLNLIGLQFKDQELTDISFYPFASPSVSPSPEKETEDAVDSGVKETVYEAPVEIEPPSDEARSASFGKVGEDPEFKRLVYVAERYRGMPLGSSGCMIFAWLYDSLGMSIDLLEYLVEYCVSRGHNSIRYMETVALDWYRRNIRELEQAKSFAPLISKDVYAVMKAFGLHGRHPAPSEKKIIDKWFADYGFNQEMVLEACNRTMTAIHKPSFEYTDRILSKWNKSGIRRVDDVKEMEEKRRVSQASKPEDKAGKKPVNRFHNFEERNYDYDALFQHMNQGTDQ